MGGCLRTQDTNNDVRQSSYALLGDCAIYVFPQLQPFLPGIMSQLIQQLDINQLTEADEDSAFSVINNACWSCGEIALQLCKSTVLPYLTTLPTDSSIASGMTPYVEKLYLSLLEIIQSPKVPSSVTENAAVALGRLGLGSCDELSPHLESFAYPFLDALAKVAETDEKDTALKGFCMVVGRNPGAMESCLVPFFRNIARYKEPSPDLRELFRQVCVALQGDRRLMANDLQTVTGYRSFIADFDGFLGQIPQQDQNAIRLNYLQ